VFHSFAEHFLKYLEEEENLKKDVVITGSCKNIEDYRYSVGYMDGITAAKRGFKDLLDKLDKDEDERRPR
tara:strand:+ start:7115 stop:7324 length:210 start_codon:yes stop_codon:yes gene_type:complete